jgi:hypothetical protein
LTPAGDRAGATARRPWYRSIAGKLLIAFALIAALTVSATWVSLIRFNQIESVMNRLTEVSLPLVQLSLGVESKTAELAVLASEVGKAENETQRFERMERLSGEMGQLWERLSRLQSIIPEEATAARLQELVAEISTKVGELDRSTRDVLLLAGQQERAFGRAIAANEVALRLLLRTTDDLLSRMTVATAPSGAAQADGAGLRKDLESLRAAYTARVDFNRLSTLLREITDAGNADALAPLRTRFATAGESLLQGLSTIAAEATGDPARADDLRAAAQSLIAIGSGNAGLLSIQEKLLPERNAVNAHQEAAAEDRARSAQRGRQAQ